MLLQTKPSKIGVVFFSTRFDIGFDVYDSCRESEVRCNDRYGGS